LSLPACADPPALRVAGARELGALAWERDVRWRDGGYSARVGERSVWVFGDTTADKNPDALPGFLNNTACATPDLDARDGLFPLVEHRDGDGYPHEFIPLTADERAHELEHGGPGCGDTCEGIALWPGPIVPDPARGRAFVFYSKLLQRPGELNITIIGTSLAVWDAALPEHAVRPEVAPGSDEPTLLFRDGEAELAAAALADGEYLLAYACDGDGFDRPCRLARAPLADPLTRAAWQWHTRRGDWSSDPDDAAPLFDGAPMMTVHHKPERGLYVAVYAAPGGTEIDLRTAPRPEGPWSDAETIHHPLAPLADSTVYGALFHPELQQDGGAVDYLTYYLGDTGTIQLVEIAWQP
jgi:hypothetical protein